VFEFYNQIFGVSKMTRYEKAVSVGVSCQPAKQIRTLLGQTEAYFFDWLISPLPAVLCALENNFSNILQPGNLSYTDDRRIRLRDAANGLEYQHDFPADRDNPDPLLRDVILPDFASHAAVARDKYARRLQRTNAVIESGTPVLIVRYVNARSDLETGNRRALVDALHRRYPGASLGFLWASPLVSGFEQSGDGYVCNLPPSAKWDGCPDGWRKAFEFCGMLAPLPSTQP